MGACGIKNQGCFAEGSTSYHDYSLWDKDGNEITVAESLEYKLSDGVTTIIDWTAISPPNAPGEITIPGADNRITDPTMKERVLTIHAVHNGGEDIFQPIRYTLVDDPNVTEDSPT